MPPELIDLPQPKDKRPMLDQPPQTVDVLIKWVTGLGGLVVLATAVITLIAWLSGGFQPGSKVASDALQAKVDTMATGIASIQSRLDALPRPSDFTQLQQQITAIQASSEARLTLLEHSMIKMQSDLDHETDVRTKQPARSVGTN